MMKPTEAATYDWARHANALNGSEGYARGIVAALSTCGAAMIAFGHATSIEGALLLGAAFYAVHRALGTPASKSLVAAPLIVWSAGNSWRILPARAFDVDGDGPLSQAHAADLAAVAMLAALLVMVGIARARLGPGLAALTIFALGCALSLRLVPARALADVTTMRVVVGAMEKGSAVVGRGLAASCVLAIGLGPPEPTPFAHRRGATAGAIGATLLAAGVAGVPSRIEGFAQTALVVFALLFVVAYVFLGVGMIAAARAGARAAGWVGFALVVASALTLVPACAVFDKGVMNAYGFAMSIPFALLGVGITLLGWNGAPFVTGKRALAMAFATAFAAGAIAWVAIWTSVLGVTNAREPWALFAVVTEPVAGRALAVVAALLVYLAWPPTLGSAPRLSEP